MTKPHQDQGEAVVETIAHHQAGHARALTPDELAELRRDMVESSAWMRAELARRRGERK